MQNLSAVDIYVEFVIGEKGQIVIPNEARKKTKLKKGGHLLVFNAHKEMIAIVKLSQVEKISSHLSEKLKIIDKVIKHTK